jgi:competence protein ComEC
MLEDLKNRGLKAPFILLALFFVLAFLPSLMEDSRAAGDLAVSFFDVGQGDAALVRSPYGQNILIDGGPDRTVLARLAEALPWWDRTIDLMVLTHPHDDHVSGLVGVLERYDVKKAAYTGVVHSAPEYLAWLEALKAGGVPLVLIDRPQTLELGAGLVLEFLWPERSLAGTETESLNDSSIAARLAYGRTAFLFTGDIEQPVEERLLSRGADLSALVLKVPHHGSDTSLSPAFLAAVNPEAAVIPVGADNRYGHPDPGALKRLAAAGARVYRTDRDGTVTFVSDGEGLIAEKTGK